MSFGEGEDGTFRRLTFNPEDVSDGKPRVFSLRVEQPDKQDFNTIKEEEFEVDREQTQFTHIHGYEVKDPTKDLLLNMLGDLGSENLVLLGRSRLDDKLVEEELKKNTEWEQWKQQRNISNWKPKRAPQTSLASPEIPVKKTGSPSSIRNYAPKKKDLKKPGKKTIVPSSPRKSSSTLASRKVISKNAKKRLKI